MLMKRLVIAAIAVGTMVSMAPDASAQPVDPFYSAVCRALDSGMSGPELVIEWKAVEKQLLAKFENVGGHLDPGYTTAGYLRKAVAAQCPQHASKVAGL